MTRGRRELRGRSRELWGPAQVAPAPWLRRLAPPAGVVAPATHLRQRTWRSAWALREWEAGPWRWANRIPGTKRKRRGRGPRSSQWGDCCQGRASRATLLLKGNARNFLRSALTLGFSPGRPILDIWPPEL